MKIDVRRPGPTKENGPRLVGFEWSDVLARHSRLRVVYEDRDLLAIDKPAGLLTVATEKERERTAYFMATDYVRKGVAKSPKRVFIVHRLDRETSGILVFAKTREAKLQLQSHWRNTRKTYLAVVHGRPPKKEDTISSHLAENRAGVVYVTSDPSKGQPARTAYRVLRQTRDLALLEINLLTGRKNQIRVHLAELGHPVAGDRKYGRKDRATRLALHALSISLDHPYNGKPLTLVAKAPVYFARLVGSIEELC